MHGYRGYHVPRVRLGIVDPLFVTCLSRANHMTARPRDPEPATDELVPIDSGGRDDRDGADSPPPPDDRDELIQQLLREVNT